MFVNDIETNLNKNLFHRNHKQWQSDNDEDCSCGSCECSSFSDENIPEDKNTMPSQSTDMATSKLIHKNIYPTSNISRVNDTTSAFNGPNRFSINYNRPAVKSLEESQMENKSIEYEEIDFEHIYEIIDQSYTKISILYKSIKQTKLDTDFILSVNDYLDRLKANIYKDLIRRETLLRNGKNHTRNLISLIRCICQISYEQAHEIPKHAILYTMTAIYYILQNNYPQKKPLFNYILHEYISMWLHENLRLIQEDFSLIVENGTKNNFFSLCLCLFNKLESICAINWERLQIIQNYRLTHFDQLIKPISNRLEINKDFMELFGKPLKLTMKISEIPVTLLYSNRTENELMNIDQIHQIFRKSIAKILHHNLIKENHQLILYSQQKGTPSVELTTSTSIVEKSTGNIISKTQTTASKPLLLPGHTSPSEIQEKRPSESKLVSLKHQQFSTSIEMIPEQYVSSTIHTHQPSSQSNSSLSQSQISPKTKSDTSPLVKIIEPINRHTESISPTILNNLFPQSSLNMTHPIVPIKSNSPSKSRSEDTLSIHLSSNDLPLQEPSNLTLEKPFTNDNPSLLSHQNSSDQTDSKSILNAEVNALIHFLTELTNSPSSLVEKLESCLKETNTNVTSIVDKTYTTHSPSSLSGQDPLFLAEFTRVLRKELEDAQILREIDCGELNEDVHHIGHLSFETSNILKLQNITISPKKKDTAAGDNIDKNRILIEVTHDPSKCSPNHAFSYSKDHSCRSSPQQFNHNSSSKSIHRKSLIFSKSNNPQSSLLESNHSQERWYWIRSNETCLFNECLITSNSLFCRRKSFDKNIYSINIEHNEQFQ